MKITDVKLTMVNWHLPTGSRLGAGGPRQLGVLAVETDQGITGNAFLGGARQGADSFAGPLFEYLKPMLVGRNAIEIGAIWKEMYDKYNRLVSLRAIGAVDIALWDIAGKAAGMPIHHLLGSTRERVPAYASSAYLETPEDYAEEAISFLEQGWTAYKMHPHGIPSDDMDIVEGVRRATGDDFVLMLDSMWAYTYEDSVRVGRVAEANGYFWYEDPLAEDDIYSYVKLRQKLDIPILATEYTPGSFYGLGEWIVRQATDMVRGDVAVKGGITPMIKMAHMAEGFRMKCEIHHGGNSLNNVANLHVTMAVPNCDYFEVLLPHEANKYGLVQDIEVDSEGFIHAPTEPGLGYEIDWELVESNTSQIIS